MHHKISVRFRLLVLLGVALLAGCARAPVQETRQFRQAFVAVDSIGQPLLDDLAVAERLLGRASAAAEARRIARGQGYTARQAACPAAWVPLKASADGGYIGGFCVADAPFFSQIGDPPRTQAFRRALAFIASFAQALAALSDGTSAAAATGQVEQLAVDASRLAAGAALASASVIPGIAQALAPAITQIAQVASIDQQRRVLLDAEPKVAALIDELAQSAPGLFNSLSDVIQSQIENGAVKADAGLARIAIYRGTVSDYVVLLGRLGAAWAQLVGAVKAPSSEANLAAITQNSAQIVADAAAVRQSLGQLRRAGPLAP